MPANIKAALFGLLAYAFFSTHDVLIKFLGVSYSPIQIIFFSVLFGFPWLTVMLVKDVSTENLRPVHPWWAALRTFAIIGSSFCAFYTFSHIPLAEAYSIVFMMPLFLTILSIPVLGEKVGLHRGGAIVMGLVGVIIVMNPQAGTELGFGHLTAVGAAFFSALASVIVRKVGRDERDVVFLLYPMLGSIIVMGSLLPFNYQPMPLEHLGAVAALAALAFLAMTCVIVAYKLGEAAVVAPMQYSQILWAIFFGIVLFNEMPDMRTLLGASVIVASGLYIVYRESRDNVSDNQPVLRTRSRIAAGSYFRIGPVMRKNRTKDHRAADVV